jgi:hypothetical protein
MAQSFSGHVTTKCLVVESSLCFREALDFSSCFHHQAAIDSSTPLADLGLMKSLVYAGVSKNWYEAKVLGWRRI